MSETPVQNVGEDNAFTGFGEDLVGDMPVLPPPLVVEPQPEPEE